MASMELVGPTPENESEFSIEWVTPILKKQLEKEGEIDPESVNVVEVKAFKNSVQGILSTTFVVDVDFEVPNENGEKELQTKHMFAKVFSNCLCQMFIIVFMMEKGPMMFSYLETYWL